MLATRTIGQLILCLSSVLLVYYILWVVGLPFAGPDDLFTQLFPHPRYALLVPAACGLVFISSLTAFTVWSIYNNAD